MTWQSAQARAQAVASVARVVAEEQAFTSRGVRDIKQRAGCANRLAIVPLLPLDAVECIEPEAARAGRKQAVGGLTEPP